MKIPFRYWIFRLLCHKQWSCRTWLIILPILHPYSIVVQYWQLSCTALQIVQHRRSQHWHLNCTGTRTASLYSCSTESYRYLRLQHPELLHGTLMTWLKHRRPGNLADQKYSTCLLISSTQRRSHAVCTHEIFGAKSIYQKHGRRRACAADALSDTPTGTVRLYRYASDLSGMYNMYWQYILRRSITWRIIAAVNSVPEQTELTVYYSAYNSGSKF